MTQKKPPAPADLAATGKALWRKLVGAYTFQPAELALLEAAARQADTVAALEAAIAEDGMMVTGSAGQPRLNAAVAEARQGRLAFAKLIDALAIPDDENRPATERSRNATHAANARWDRKRRELDSVKARVARGEA